MSKKKPASKLRGSWINVTVTAAEKKRIQRKADNLGMTLSSYARFKLLGSRELTAVTDDATAAA